MTASNLPREARALLDAIAQGESDPEAKREGISPYFILYRGGSFEKLANREGHYGFPAWPGKDNSHAAGRYQFQPATWLGIRPRFGAWVPNFRHPDDQDWGAWFLAQHDYQARTHRELLTDLRAGGLGGIGHTLQPTWTSLSDGTFPQRYAAALATYPVEQPRPAPVPAPPMPAPQPPPAPPAPVPPPPVPVRVIGPTGPPTVLTPLAGTLPVDIIAKAPWWMLPSIGTMVLAIFAGALAASCFMDNDTLRTQMFAIAGSGFTMMLGYFFGSSAGSQKKDDVATAKALSSPPTP